MTRILAMLLLCVSTAWAGERIPPASYDCVAVRAFVAEHGRVKALAMAIENGATWKQLREARKCLR
jgi:hypothetical protein